MLFWCWKPPSWGQPWRPGVPQRLERAGQWEHSCLWSVRPVQNDGRCWDHKSEKEKNMEFAVLCLFLWGIYIYILQVSKSAETIWKLGTCQKWCFFFFFGGPRAWAFFLSRTSRYMALVAQRFAGGGKIVCKIDAVAGRWVKANGVWSRECQELRTFKWLKLLTCLYMTRRNNAFICIWLRLHILMWSLPSVLLRCLNQPSLAWGWRLALFLRVGIQIHVERIWNMALVDQIRCRSKPSQFPKIQILCSYIHLTYPYPQRNSRLATLEFGGQKVGVAESETAPWTRVESGQWDWSMDSPLKYCSTVWA